MSYVVLRLAFPPEAREGGAMVLEFVTAHDTEKAAREYVAQQGHSAEWHVILPMHLGGAGRCSKCGFTPLSRHYGKPFPGETRCNACSE